MFDEGAVESRLAALGFEAGEGDKLSLAFCIDKVRSSIKSKTHLDRIPPELDGAAVDMAAGEFLLAKKAFSPESFAGLDLGPAVKQLQEGDTNTVFAVGEGSMTDEQRLEVLVRSLLSREKEIFHYRRLKW